MSCCKVFKPCKGIIYADFEYCIECGNKRLQENQVNSPILDTIWQRCFWEVAAEMKRRECDTIEFYDVDQLVIEKSKMALPDFIKWLED